MAKYGTRLLHVTSDLVSPDHLCVEGQNGVCERIHVDDLYDLFETHCENIDPKTRKKKLLIDIVAIAIPDSVKIGQKFIDLGVPHVLTFEIDREKQRNKIQ